MSRLIKAIAVTAALGIPFVWPAVPIVEARTAAPLALLELFAIWFPILTLVVVGSFEHSKETLSSRSLPFLRTRGCTNSYMSLLTSAGKGTRTQRHSVYRHSQAWPSC
ncbi:MAG: hypothetical protein K0R28_7114 [Paenibacillus sp.]|jgi:hypothetical protein|nr:hypothetical protein [Paenibacillus sp.]